jgi:hypothetical protein
MKQAKSSNMKEKVIFTTALCLSAMTQMMAQNITGKVMNTKGEPLVFANVVLLNRTDSAFVKGAVSGEDGSFVIDSYCNAELDEIRADLGPDAYLTWAQKWVELGASIIGGCCGITPDHITKLTEQLK